MLQKLKETQLESALTVLELFDEDAKEALKLMAFTAATPMTNLLLLSDEGLKLLTLLSAIIFGAKLETGSDTEPYFKFMTAHRNIEIEYPLQNITAALWVNIQHEAEKLREKMAAANPEQPE